MTNAWQFQRKGSHRAGHLIRDLREQAGLSRAELAARLGISAFYLRKIEYNVDRPGAGTIVKILRALGLTEDRSERVERLRAYAVKLPSAELDHIILLAIEDGGDFEDIQTAIYLAKVEWMRIHGAPDGAQAQQRPAGQDALRHVA